MNGETSRILDSLELVANGSCLAGFSIAALSLQHICIIIPGGLQVSVITVFLTLFIFDRLVDASEDQWGTRIPLTSGEYLSNH